LRANRKSAFGELLVWVEFAQRIQRFELLLEHIGATGEGSNVRMLLKYMVGPCGLEPQTSTVSKGREYLRPIA
jgi:hypothetical protein